MSELIAAQFIRDVPDFPKPGILFKDITPVLANPAALREVVERLTEDAVECRPDLVVGIESRGFIFGIPVALGLDVGFAPVRKVGKLPHTTVREEYFLEYGAAAVEIHADSVIPGQRVYVVDDLLATGGTALATARLIERLGGTVCGFGFFIELGFLNGRHQLEGYTVNPLVRFE